MDINETQIGSVSDLLAQLSALENNNSTLFFRGHANKCFTLKPYVYREEKWLQNEDTIIREMIMRCPAEFSSMRSNFEKLVKMQHYGLPTRLLDLTENPLVALYFACIGEKEKDVNGEVIFFNIPKVDIKYYDSDTVSVVSNIAWSESNFEVGQEFSSLKNFHNEANHHAQKLMHNIGQEKPHFLPKIKPKDLERVLCVKPKMDNQRLIRQDGAFLLFGVNKTKHDAASIPPKWVYKPDSKRCIIKSENKDFILNELSKLGISRAKLFPEIDTVSEFLKNDFQHEDKPFVSNLPKYSKSVDFS